MSINDGDYRVAMECFGKHFSTHYGVLRRCGVEEEDFVQECLIKFAATYDPDKGAAKNTWAYFIANSVYKNCVKSAHRGFRPPPNGRVEFSDTLDHKGVVGNGVQNKNYLIEEVEEILSNVVFGRSQIPALDIFRGKMEGQGLSDIARTIYDKHGKKVTSEGVRQYWEKTKTIVKEAGVF